MSKFLITGLGNIGVEYAGTRHNIGFDVLDLVAAKHGAVFAPGRLADIAEVRWKGKVLILAKPTTYMNLSGKTVKYWLDKEKIPVENSLTILDDLALPLSKVRLRHGGSDAGHNGLKSIQELLGTDQYPRLRYGIGNQYPKGMQVDFVLGRWTAEEKPLVELKARGCVDIVESFVSMGVERTMNQVNKLDFKL